MGTRTRNEWLKKAGALSILPMAALGLSACSGDTAGPEESTSVEDVVEEDDAAADDVDVDSAVDPYVGTYDSTFYDDYDSFVGESVTVSAEVNEIISPNAFTIAGTDDTTVDELLIVHNLDAGEVEQGLTVAVTGFVEESFDVASTEEELDIDLDDALFTDWEEERFIDATELDTSVDADAGEDT